jgi:hypothetical protein
MKAPKAGSTPAATPVRLQPGSPAAGGGACGPVSSTTKITSINAIETASTASTIRADTRTPRSTSPAASAARTTTAAAPTAGGGFHPSRPSSAPV